MLFDIDDVNNLFAKKVHCFGLAATTPAILGSATALQANMAILAAVGTGVSVMGQMQQGQQAANQARFQAQVAQNDAIIAGQQRDRAIKTAASNEADYRRAQDAEMGRRFSLFGNTGVQRGAGAPLAVSRDFAGETELQALRLRNEGDVTANRLQQSVLNQQSQAGLFATKARNERTNTFTRAGGELFSGAFKTASSFR